jgi:hypothetical protein
MPTFLQTRCKLHAPVWHFGDYNAFTTREDLSATDEMSLHSYFRELLNFFVLHGMVYRMEKRMEALNMGLSDTEAILHENAAVRRLAEEMHRQFPEDSYIQAIMLLPPHSCNILHSLPFRDLTLPIYTISHAKTKSTGLVRAAFDAADSMFFASQFDSSIALPAHVGYAPHIVASFIRNLGMVGNIDMPIGVNEELRIVVLGSIDNQIRCCQTALQLYERMARKEVSLTLLEWIGLVDYDVHKNLCTLPRNAEPIGDAELLEYCLKINAHLQEPLIHVTPRRTAWLGSVEDTSSKVCKRIRGTKGYNELPVLAYYLVMSFELNARIRWHEESLKEIHGVVGESTNAWEAGVFTAIHEYCRPAPLFDLLTASEDDGSGGQ